MRVGALTLEEFDNRLSGRSGLRLRLGPFRIKLLTNVAALAPVVHDMWRDFVIAECVDVCDLHAGLVWSAWHRRWLRPQIQFLLDGRPPFLPLPGHHHLAMLEWGLNWAIAQRSHHLLMLHAAVVERDGRAILLPAAPGHGKSTLCAALAHSSWRLLSDEFGLVRPEDGALLPLPRLIPLKNESIEVIRTFAPGAYIGPNFYGTRKGTVAHVRPPTESVERMEETAWPGWLVFPRWVAGAPLQLEPMRKAEAFLMVASNAFNYEVLGQTGFELVGRMVDRCDCYTLVYSDLAEAVAALDEMTGMSGG